MNMIAIKALVTSKLAVLVLLLTLIWSIFDTNSRLSTSRVLNENKESKLAVTAIASPKLADSVLAAIQQRYEKYNQINHDDVKVDVVGMSTEDQNKQQGELTELFIDNNKLSLKAVIRNNTPANNSEIANQTIALISIVDTTTGDEKIEKYTQNSQVYGYLLSIKTNTQVKLVKMQGTSNQQITLTMYKN